MDPRHQTDTFEITAVRTVKTVEASHEHVVRVRLNGEVGDEGVHRTVIVEDLIHQSGRSYYVRIGQHRVSVLVVMCPHCAYPVYLTTSADPIAPNRLLELERF